MWFSILSWSKYWNGGVILGHMFSIVHKLTYRHPRFLYTRFLILNYSLNLCLMKSTSCTGPWNCRLLKERHKSSVDVCMCILKCWRSALKLHGTWIHLINHDIFIGFKVFACVRDGGLYLITARITKAIVSSCSVFIHCFVRAQFLTQPLIIRLIHLIWSVGILLSILLTHTVAQWFARPW